MRIEWIGHYPQHVAVLAQWHHAQWGELYEDWTLPVAEAELQDHTRQRSLPTTLLLMDADTLLGSVSLLWEDAPALQDRGSPWLASLYVCPQARGLGAGKRLVDAAVAHAAAHRVDTLRLFTLWHESFYAGLGWTLEERTHLHHTPVSIMRIAPAQRLAQLGAALASPIG